MNADRALGPDDALRRLRAADPAEHAFGPVEAELVDDALRRRLAAPPRSRRRAPRRASLLLAPGAALAALGLAFVLAADRGAAPARAAASLRALARVLPDDRPLAAGERAYSRVRSDVVHMFSSSRPGGSIVAIEPTVVEVWQDREGRGHLRATASFALRFPTAADRRAWFAPANARQRKRWGELRVRATRLGTPRADYRFSARQLSTGSGVLPLSWAQVSGLPRSVTPLRDALAHVAAGRRGGVPQLIVDLLDLPAVGRSLRAALYDVLAAHPGLRQEQLRDPDGRQGLAIAIPMTTTSSTTLVFRPDTGELLARRETHTERIGAHGTSRRISAWTVIEATGRARGGSRPR